MSHIQLTQQEVSLLVQVVGQLNINPAADDASAICALVQSIKGKLGALLATEQPAAPAVSEQAPQECLAQ